MNYILCTDGLSNVGLGMLDEANKIAAATAFYKVFFIFIYFSYLANFTFKGYCWIRQIA